MSNPNTRGDETIVQALKCVLSSFSFNNLPTCNISGYAQQPIYMYIHMCMYVCVLNAYVWLYIYMRIGVSEGGTIHTCKPGQHKS